MPVPSAAPVPEPSFSDVDETDLRRAEEHLTADLRLDHAPEPRFALHLHRVSRGPLCLEEVRCSEAVRMRIDDDPGYVVGLPIRGPLRTDHRGGELDLRPGQAAVLTPFAEAAMVTGGRADVVLVRVRAATLEEALEALLGRSVQRPLRLQSSTGLGTAAGRPGPAWSGPSPWPAPVRPRR